MNEKNERALNGDNELTGQIDALRQGDRRALAKTITLIESTRNDHRRQAAGIVQSLLPDTGRAIRLGISGVPGVGKSTFIEALGLYLIEQGYKLAVLAVDPSSQRTGGSIMGDKPAWSVSVSGWRPLFDPLLPVAPSAAWRLRLAKPCCCARRRDTT